MNPSSSPSTKPAGSLKIVCPQCLRRYQANPTSVGKSIKCKHCDQSFPLQMLGHYQILNELGRGAFGTVSRCFDTRLDRLVAIKILQGKWSTDQQVVARFKNESRIMAKINHPNIVPLFDWAETGQEMYFVSALVSGTELRSVIPATGFEDPVRAVQVAIALLDALDYVHTTHKVWHRDIKPANIMMDERNFVYLLDFGIAACRTKEDAFTTAPGTSLGTPAYMAPEQAGGDGEVGPWSDQYSVGVVLYHLLTGHVPFEKPPPYLFVQILEEIPPPLAKHRSDLDPDLEALVLRSLAKAPKDRFGSCKEFADALRAWVAGHGTGGGQAHRLRWWAIATVAVALLGVVAAGGAVTLAYFLHAPSTAPPPVKFQKEEWTPDSVPSADK